MSVTPMLWPLSLRTFERLRRAHADIGVALDQIHDREAAATGVRRG